MSPILQALIPVLLLILVGYLLRRAQLPGAGFWPAMERLTYYVLFPSLLVANLSPTDIHGQPMLELVITIVLALLVATLLLLLLRPLTRLTGPQFTSLFQGSIRFNTYIGIAVASALYGAEGLTLAAITSAILIPLVNLLCVVILINWGDHDQNQGWVRFGAAILKNPLLLASLGGIGLAIIGLRLPAPIAGTLELLGRAALPMGLLAVGAGLTLTAVRTHGYALLLSCVTKLAVMPLLMWFTAGLVGLPSPATTIVTLFAALPGATSAYILARQMGGDYELMAGMVTLQTAGGVITLPVILVFLV